LGNESFDTSNCVLRKSDYQGDISFLNTLSIQLNDANAYLSFDHLKLSNNAGIISPNTYNYEQIVYSDDNQEISYYYYKNNKRNYLLYCKVEIKNNNI
jgi:hypothetical protein